MLLTFFCKELHISRMTLGIAGLKDKDAVKQNNGSVSTKALSYKKCEEKEYLLIP